MGAGPEIGGQVEDDSPDRSLKENQDLLAITEDVLAIVESGVPVSGIKELDEGLRADLEGLRDDLTDKIEKQESPPESN